MRGRTLRVCYFGTYRAEYSRNQIMIEGLRRNGVEVVECHRQLWYDIEDRVKTASGGWMQPSFVRRLLRTYVDLLRKYRQVSEYDVMVLGYPGYLDAPVARLLSRLRGKPLVLDCFMSTYLIAVERGLEMRSPFTIRLLKSIERVACHLADLLISDTPEYAAWFQRMYGLSASRFSLVPTGADDRIFKPLKRPKANDGVFKVVYYGSFIPNHGVEYIVEAARILANEADIRFELIGDGPEKDKAIALARRYSLNNVEFTGWLEKEELVKRIAEADVCLGVFGTTPQSLMTIQNKIYEALAMGKPVITGDSPVVRRIFENGRHLWLCKRADARSIAEAILTLRENKDFRVCLATQGSALFRSRFSLTEVGVQFRKCLEGLAKCAC